MSYRPTKIPFVRLGIGLTYKNILYHIMVSRDQHTSNGLKFMLEPGYGSYFYLCNLFI